MFWFFAMMNWPSIIYPLHQCVWPECWERFMISLLKGDYGLVTLWSFRPNFLKIIKNLLISLEVKTQEHQGPNHSNARNSKAKPGLESFSTVSSLHHPFFLCNKIVLTKSQVCIVPPSNCLFFLRGDFTHDCSDCSGWVSVLHSGLQVRQRFWPKVRVSWDVVRDRCRLEIGKGG